MSQQRYEITRFCTLAASRGSPHFLLPVDPSTLRHPSDSNAWQRTRSLQQVSSLG